jgi:PhnB protein
VLPDIDHHLAEQDVPEVPISTGKTFFSPRFGMIADRFGVSWMIVTTPTT